MKITKEFVINTYYNGIHPTCKCGCGTLLSFKPLKNGPWFATYTKNHAPKKTTSEETKNKIKESYKKTMIEKYGVENSFQLPSVKESIKNTLLKKYGVDNIMKTPDHRERVKRFKHSDATKEKIKSANKAKYNANSFTATNAGKAAIRSKNFQKHFGSWESYQQRLQNHHLICLSTYEIFNSNPTIPLKFKCELCKSEWDEILSLIPTCVECELLYVNKSRSKLEQSLFNWLKSYDIEFVTNKIFTKDSVKLSLDVFIPSANIGIELNGLWWHSEVHGNKEKRYHINKLEFFNSLGIRVINIFDDEWTQNANIIKTKLLHILKKSNAIKLHARKCNIQKINYRTASDFLKESHIQGPVKCLVYYGAYHDTELVAVMTFSKIRKFIGSVNSTGYELVRFATKSKYKITGIASRLLNQFIKEYEPTVIISYADRRFTDKINNLYTTLNFKIKHTTSPSYFYVKGSRRFHRLNFTKHSLVKKGADPALSEWAIMRQMKYDRIWDCGHFVYEMILK